MKMEKCLSCNRWHREAGIAIGPILFIIAILAILAAAIAAGSGSFNAPTATEGAKTKSSALIQVGDNLKMGMDRMTMENGVSWGGWTISPSSTSANSDLFSPTGGGIAPPSTSLAGDPANDVWYYPVGPLPGLGSNDQLAVLNVASDVCNEVNNRAMGQSTSWAANVGDFAASNSTTADTAISAWPTNLHGKTIGCVQNGSMSNHYFFYEVLFIE